MKTAAQFVFLSYTTLKGRNEPSCKNVTIGNLKNNQSSERNEAAKPGANELLETGTVFPPPAPLETSTRVFSVCN